MNILLNLTKKESDLMKIIQLNQLRAGMSVIIDETYAIPQISMIMQISTKELRELLKSLHEKNFIGLINTEFGQLYCYNPNKEYNSLNPKIVLKN